MANNVVFDWGDESAIGDADWWKGLSEYLYNLTATERLALVGKKKKVSLSSPVLGANAASMICIGSDIDGEKTLTFQTEGVLPKPTPFGDNSLWNDSIVKNLCEDFGNYCSANASIKSITKLTSVYCNDRKDNAANILTTAKCWLPSECEMGFTSSNGCASSYTEWTKERKIQFYQYYTSDNRRIKYLMKPDGSLTIYTYWYWERSRYYNASVSYSVCGVNSNGSAYYDYYMVSCGLAPAFTIEATSTNNNFKETRKTMTNFEKYKDKITEILLTSGDAPALTKDGKLLPCSSMMSCNDCNFNLPPWSDSCEMARVEWFNREYEIDWSKVAVDTKVLVNMGYDDENRWVKRYFAKYENGKVYTFDGGATSWSSYMVSCWDHAKLAEEEDG